MWDKCCPNCGSLLIVVDDLVVCTSCQYIGRHECDLQSLTPRESGCAQPLLPGSFGRSGP